MLINTPSETNTTVVATAALLRHRPSLQAECPEGTHLLEWGQGRAQDMHPQILLVTPRDLVQEESESLHEYLRTRRGCRMVLVGGTNDKDTLLQSINVWRVARIIPAETAAAEVWLIVQQVIDATNLANAVHRTAERLTDENQQLEKAINELQSAQKNLLHTERLSTVGRIAHGLVTSIRHHLDALDDFSEVARGSCNTDTRSFMDLAFDATRSVSALLEEMQGYTNDTSDAHKPSDESLNDIVSRAIELVGSTHCEKAPSRS